MRYFSLTFIICISGFLSGCGRTVYEQGYDAGKGDVAKNQYWIIQNRQKEDNANKSISLPIKYYKFQSPTEVNGVKFVPHTITVRSVDL